MRPRPTPRRGLLAGLLALILFASAAIAMTAGGAGPAANGTAPTLAAQRVVSADDGALEAGGRFGGRHRRVAAVGDADGRDGGWSGLSGHHR
jgi:hypothetical protein